MRVMKDSGIEWIGEIPQDWEVKRVDNIYSLRNQKVSDVDFAPLSVTKKGVFLQLENVAKSNAHDERKLVCRGDFVINSRSDRRGSCGISQYDGSVSLINTVIYPSEGVCNRYYGWLFCSNMFADEFYKWGHGIVADLWTTSWQEMKTINIPIPPVPTQQAIADYLDRQCGVIDGLVEDVNKEIEKLKEYKKAVITETVTGKQCVIRNSQCGIKGKRPMKDSGIEWIGQIPQDWEVVKVGRFFDIEHGIDPLTEDGDTPVYGSGSKSFKTCKEFKEGPTVLLGRKGTIGVPQYIEGKFWNVDTAFNIVLKRSFDVKLFYYIACCFDYKIYVTQTTIPSMTQEDYKRMKMPIPPLLEQQAIVAYLDKKCEEINALVAEKEKQSAKLQEYKKALIFECVTGKREVA